MLVAVAALEKVEHLLLWDETRGAESRDSEHFEKQKVSLRLHLLLSVARQHHEPREYSQEVHDEAAVEHVARRNQLDAINGVVVLRVGVAREEVLDDLEQEEDLGVLQDKVDCVALLSAESDDIKIEQHIRDDDD